MQYNDTYALPMVIEKELRPIIDYLQLHYIDGELKSVGLNCSFKEFNQQTHITKKEIIKLLDLFQDNIRATEEAIKYIKEGGEQNEK